MRHSTRLILILLALSICAYLPALRLPFISDDYGQIPLARQYAAQGWTPLWYNTDLRARATYMFLSAAIDRMFGFTPMPFYAADIVLHAICVLLIYAAAIWSELGVSVAFWAACFFAISEGHQEAVMWAAASSDLLVFLFGMAAWVCWMKWLKEGRSTWYAAAIASFLLALASKESAWAFPLLMLIPTLVDRRNWARELKAIAPFFALTAAYIAWTWLSRVAKPGYNDIRFSLSAMWPVVILNSFWHLVFPWGILAAGVLWWLGGTDGRRKIWIASLWMVVGIVPYSFLSYMNRIPSRHTYIASAGLAVLVGAAAVRLHETRRRALLVSFCATVLIANLEILWVKKMGQYRERAEPSELLKQAAAKAKGPILIECTPMYKSNAEAVLEEAGSLAEFSPNLRQEDHCFQIQYRTTDGRLVQVDRQIGMAKHGLLY